MPNPSTLDELLRSLRGPRDVASDLYNALSTIVYKAGGTLTVTDADKYGFRDSGTQLVGRLGDDNASYTFSLVSPEEAARLAREEGLDTFGRAPEPEEEEEEEEEEADPEATRIWQDDEARTSPYHDFKTGDRVRYLNPACDCPPDAHEPLPRPGYIGTVIHPGPRAPYVRFDDLPEGHSVMQEKYAGKARATTFCVDVTDIELVEEAAA